MAIDLQLIDHKSFKPAFFDKMEQINYARYVDGLTDKYVPPSFIDGKND